MRFYTLLPLLLISTITALRFATQSNDAQRNDQVHEIVSTAAKSLQHQIDTIIDEVEQQKELSEVRLRYEKVRSVFRSIDFLVEYVDPTFVTQFLNGAPLPKLDAKSQFVDVLEPHGLQVIDEHLGEWAESEQYDTTPLKKELLELKSRLSEAAAICLNTYWSDRMLLEACRSGIIRFTSMGITGFDRPGTGPSLEEYAAWANSTIIVLDLFQSDADRKGATNILVAAKSHLMSIRDSICMLPDSSLDKVELIRSHLDPVFREVAKLHETLGIEYNTEIGPAQPVLNPRAQSMFHESFFNAAATSGLHYQSITKEMINLGKTLFFDPILSGNGERSCSSCHDPRKSFTDGYKTSLAYDGVHNIRRNSPTLINAVFSRRFFYDFRAMRLSDVIAHVITDSLEFNSTLFDVVGRIRESDEYVAMFERAFSTRSASSVTSTNIHLAISAYLTTLVSMNSRVDRYLRGEDVVLTAQERSGMNVFMGKALCATCHFPPTFAGYVPPAFVESESEIIGVPQHKAAEHAVPDQDIGRAGGILREKSVIYVGSFKTPTVRNAARTAPYFHNGAYDDLADVIDFYVRGGGNGIGLQLEYQTLPFTKLELNDQDRRDLVSFINALTDTIDVQIPEKLPRHPREPYLSRVVSGTY